MRLTRVSEPAELCLAQHSSGAQLCPGHLRGRRLG